MMKFERFLPQEAVERALRNTDIYIVSKVSTLPACNQKCGQLFLHSFEKYQHKKDD